MPYSGFGATAQCTSALRIWCLHAWVRHDAAVQLRQVADRAAKQEEEWGAAYRALKAENAALGRVKDDYAERAAEAAARGDRLDEAVALLEQQLAAAQKVRCCLRHIVCCARQSEHLAAFWPRGGRCEVRCACRSTKSRWRR